MIRLFTGYDSREAAGWHVFAESVMKHTSEPVQITPICKRLEGGTNAFTRSRFLAPHLCDYNGWALFADGSDMLLRADLAELWAFKNLGGKALWCTKHNYATRHARKYVGTSMEADNKDYERKNWASLFLMDCSKLQHWTPEFVERAPILSLLQFQGIDDALIGALPMEWNWLIGEHEIQPGQEDAVKLAHYTLGIPSFWNYRNSDFSTEWFEHYARVTEGEQ